MTEADDTRARILEKATQLFVGHGYSRVTMDDVCAELRMSKKTLYRFFSSKEELCQAALVANFAQIGEEISAVLADEQRDFADRMRDFVRTVASHYARGGTVLRDIQRDAPALWQRLLEMRRAAVQERFGKLYAAGVKAGAFRDDVEPRAVIRMVLTLVDQLLRPEVLAELETTAEQLFPQMLSVVMDGVRTRPAPATNAAKKVRGATKLASRR